MPAKKNKLLSPTGKHKGKHLAASQLGQQEQQPRQPSIYLNRKRRTLVEKVGRYAFIERQGVLCRALLNSQGAYSFSEISPGTQSLVLLGDLDQHGRWLAKHGHRRIEVEEGVLFNSSLPHIYAKLSLCDIDVHKNGDVYLSATYSVTSHLLKSAANLYSGPNLVEPIEGIIDLIQSAADGFSAALNNVPKSERKAARKRKREEKPPFFRMDINYLPIEGGVEVPCVAMLDGKRMRTGEADGSEEEREGRGEQKKRLYACTFNDVFKALLGEAAPVAEQSVAVAQETQVEEVSVAPEQSPSVLEPDQLVAMPLEATQEIQVEEVPVVPEKSPPVLELGQPVAMPLEATQEFQVEEAPVVPEQSPPVLELGQPVAMLLEAAQEIQAEFIVSEEESVLRRAREVIFSRTISTFETTEERQKEKEQESAKFEELCREFIEEGLRKRGSSLNIREEGALERVLQAPPADKKPAFFQKVVHGIYCLLRALGGAAFEKPIAFVRRHDAIARAEDEQFVRKAYHCARVARERSQAVVKREIAGTCEELEVAQFKGESRSALKRVLEQEKSFDLSFQASEQKEDLEVSEAIRDHLKVEMKSAWSNFTASLEDIRGKTRGWSQKRKLEGRSSQIEAVKCLTTAEPTPLDVLKEKRRAPHSSPAVSSSPGLRVFALATNKSAMFNQVVVPDRPEPAIPARTSLLVPPCSV